MPPHRSLPSYPPPFPSLILLATIPPSLHVSATFAVPPISVPISILFAS